MLTHLHDVLRAESCLHVTKARFVLQVLTVAKDQNGCRYLQRKFEEGGAAAIGTVFPEVLDNLIDLQLCATCNISMRCSSNSANQVSVFADWHDADRSSRCGPKGFQFIVFQPS